MLCLACLCRVAALECRDPVSYPLRVMAALEGEERLLDHGDGLFSKNRMSGEIAAASVRVSNARTEQY